MKRIHTALLATVLGTALLAGCERPSMESNQTGYRGLAMGQVSNPRIVGPIQAAQKLPDPIPPMPPGGALAKSSFKNVQVLGDLTANEFTRTMLAITAWVSPKEGCAYCHKPGDDMSLDNLYTKVVARRMLQMTRTINADWKVHVAATGPTGAGGVTCYTCHRGAPVPAKIWFTNPGPKQPGGATGQSGGQNHPAYESALTALNVDPLTPFLLGNTSLRSAGASYRPTTAKPASIQDTERAFGLMMHMSKSLGVNCTFCHNTRYHVGWTDSPPQRTTAFHGIRMARELNNTFLVPLTSTFPANRLGPTGDVAKISCATCHQGINRPLKGAPLLKDYPAFGTPPQAVAAAALAGEQVAAVSEAAVTPVAAKR
jgi:photosynthetic reaction center cytochrome c subunit